MKEKDFEELVGSIRQAGKIRRGEVKPNRVTEFAPVDVRAIHHRLAKSPSEFARMIGVTVAALQNWEQGRITVKRPGGVANGSLYRQERPFQ